MYGFKEIKASARATRQGAAPLAARLPQFIGLSTDAVEVLKGLKVALVGAGSVGRNIALHLARLVGTLWLVDRGRLKAESVLTHPMTLADVSKRKASNLGRAVKALNPAVRVFAFDGPVERLPLPSLAEADLVALATDGLYPEVEVGQRCMLLGKPLVHASVFGEALVAQVGFFANHDGQGPCPACGFGDAERSALNHDTRFSCEGAKGEGPAAAEATGQPTMSTSFLCSLAADLALNQILRFVLKLGKPVGDTLVDYCGYTHACHVTPLVRNPECPCDHVRAELRPVPRPLADLTLRELAAEAGFGGDAARDGLSFALGELAFCESGVCRCPGLRPVGRFVAPGHSVGRCRECRSAIVPHPQFMHRPAPGSAVAAILNRPSRDLGADAARWAVVREEGRAVLLLKEVHGHEID